MFVGNELREQCCHGSHSRQRRHLPHHWRETPQPRGRSEHSVAHVQLWHGHILWTVCIQSKFQRCQSRHMACFRSFSSLKVWLASHVGLIRSSHACDSPSHGHLPVVTSLGRPSEFRPRGPVLSRTGQEILLPQVEWHLS